jgi:hypothetical protein
MRRGVEGLKERSASRGCPRREVVLPSPQLVGDRLDTRDFAGCVRNIEPFPETGQMSKP